MSGYSKGLYYNDGGDHLVLFEPPLYDLWSMYPGLLVEFARLKSFQVSGCSHDAAEIFLRMVLEYSDGTRNSLDALPNEARDVISRSASILMAEAVNPALSRYRKPSCQGAQRASF